ncbi:tetratricopeptide repeat protein [Streptomyces alboniger]|uniref:Tetratricopeptide repeat protein n=1 Tax=Streptomyces alboniger TaxID=132473 RepID=A0A5J6HTG4_STRAD|nr:tetratricopeptide repeat protein [Streptomyces alboniger]
MDHGSESRVDPSVAQTKEELSRFMHMLRARADSPSYRDLEKAAVSLGTSLPRTTLGEVLRGRRFPSKAFLLTFVRLCGADLEEMQVWEGVWNRLAVQYKVAEPSSTAVDPASPDLLHERRRSVVLERELKDLRAQLKQQSLLLERAARAWTNVGDALRREGHWASAGVVYGAVADLQSALPASGTDVAFRARLGVIEVLAAQGQYADAETAALQLTNECTKVLGADHPDTLAAQQMLVTLGNPPSARQISVRPGVSDPDGSLTLTRSEPHAASSRVPGALPPVWNLEPRNPQFTGRDGILRRLRERFDLGGASVVQALRGLGGVGKTQIAVEYAHQRAYAYDVVWWIAADDSSLVGDQIAALAVELALVERDTDTATAAAVAKAHLRGRDRWLIIFDNAEERAAVSEWLPGGPGHVLITSRVGGWESIAATMQVEGMAALESVALLQAHCPDLGRGEAELLAEQLDFLPLALCQAGGFLSETATEVGDYLNLLSTHPAALLSEGEAGDYPRSLAAVIGLSLDQLAQADPVGLAIVRVCALLAPESVPVRWLMTRGEWESGDDESIAVLTQVAEDEMRLRRAIGTAVRFGLAKGGRDGVRLHRLVQGVVKDLLPAIALESMRRHSHGMLVENDPGNPESPSTWAAWAHIVPHVLAVEPTTSRNPRLRPLACKASWYLIERGDADAGTRLAISLRSAWLRELGADDVHVLWVTRCLARGLREQGRYEEARRLYDDALPRYHRVLGPRHTDTLRLAHGSAINLRMLGRYEAARQLQGDTFDSYRDVLGQDHPHTLHSANHLAVDLSILGHHDEARRLHEDTLARYRRVIGDDHPDTLRSANHLAADLVALGDHAHAKALDEDTLDRCRRVFGEDHPYTLRAANSYATILRKLGDLRQALTLQEETLARSQQILGADHPQTLRTAHALSETLHHSQQLARAEDLQADTVQRYRQVLGDDHPDTRNSVDLLEKITARK